MKKITLGLALILALSANSLLLAGPIDVSVEVTPGPGFDKKKSSAVVL